MKYLPIGVVVGCALLCSVGAGADTPGIAGDWRDPTGSVIRIAPCSQGLCARIVKLTADAPATTDTNNPKVADRGRALCGLTIGQGFRLTDAQHADGGSLYDPRTGRTYSGEMTRDGDTLNLRGYVGFKMFGRTETWHKTTLVGQGCSAG
jgi:uncharacterized protein (DUF2147 family)